MVEQCISIIEQAFVSARRKGMLDVMLGRLLKQQNAYQTEQTVNLDILFLEYVGRLSSCETFDERFYECVLGMGNEGVCAHGYKIAPLLTTNMINKIKTQITSKLQALFLEGTSPLQAEIAHLKLMGSSSLEIAERARGHKGYQSDSYSGRRESTPHPQNSFSDAQNAYLSKGVPQTHLESHLAFAQAVSGECDFPEPTDGKAESPLVDFLIVYVGNIPSHLQGVLSSCGIQAGSLVHIQFFPSAIRFKGCFADRLLPFSICKEIYGICLNDLLSES